MRLNTEDAPPEALSVPGPSVGDVYKVKGGRGGPRFQVVVAIGGYPACLAAEVAAAVADPPAGAAAPLGRRPLIADDLAAIKAALEAAWNDPEAYGYFAGDFAFGHLDRLDRFGADTRFSVRQWAVIDEILARHAEITAREAGEENHG